MYTQSQITPLIALVAAIYTSADDTGCSDDLTVARKSAIDAAQKVIDSLVPARLVVGQHDHREGFSLYAFAVPEGTTFDDDTFKTYLDDVFEEDRREFANVTEFTDKDINLFPADGEVSAPADDSDELEKFIDAAQQHGEDSDPDHEVGDLQDYLRAMWTILTPQQRAAFPGLSDVRTTYEAAGGN